MRLNPSLQRWTTPANDPDFVLYVPAGTKDKYEQNIAAIPADKRIWWRAHRVLDGETLAGIARELRISPVSLAEANQLTPTATLEAGSHLVVPMAVGTDASLARFKEPVPHRLVEYRVRPGDTLDLLADRYNVTPYQIRRWNGLRSARLTTGRTLRLYVEAQAAAPHRTTTPSRPAPSTQHHPSTLPAAARKKPAAHAGPGGATASSTAR